jgi:phosphopantetheinyl transferase
VGVDIERVVACDERFALSICTPDELSVGAPRRDHEIISLWSSKEALAKALGDARAYDPRRLGSPVYWSDGTSGPWRARELPVPDGYCAWVCWRSQAAG